jgi:hypothetical protein
MQNDRKEAPGEQRRRLSNLIITRSPSSRGEIPDDAAAERDADDRARAPVRVEIGDTGEVDQQS